MKKKVSVGVLIGFVVLTALAAFTLSYVILWNSFTDRINNLTVREAAFYKMSEVSAYVQEFFAGDADDDKLTDGAVKGYVDALDDPGSYYFTAEQVEERENANKLNYTGIGIESCFDGKFSGIRILGMYVGSTAAKAGLRQLDVITRVDGEAVAYLGYETALEKIRGEEGTQVMLTVFRETSGSYFELSVRRGAVMTDRELSCKLLEDDVGYIRLDNFDIGTDEKFVKVYNDLKNRGMKALVVDLRMNSSGYMSVMSSIADIFLSEAVIYSEKRMDGEEYAAQSDEKYEDIPLVVIVDEYSLNAAEYFAAALSQNYRAYVVGSKTGGSGYAQNAINFADGSQLILSTTKYFTPDGSCLSGEGFVPDAEADMTTTEKISALMGGYDLQLRLALDNLE